MREVQLVCSRLPADYMVGIGDYDWRLGWGDWESGLGIGIGDWGLVVTFGFDFWL